MQDPAIHETAASAVFADAPMWEKLGRRLEKVTVAGATAHELGPLAAERWRSLGLQVPPALLRQERAARIAQRFAPTILAHARAAFDGPMIVFKGPEVAARYPPGTRRFSDVDLLVQDAAAAQQALLAVGFELIDDPTSHFEDLHHLTPLRWQTLPLQVEIHSTLKWPRQLPSPDLDAIFRAAVPASSPVEGLHAPAPTHHALILAAHSWAHTPLRTARDLVDVAAMAAEAGEDEVAALADEWGLARIWHTISAAADWLLAGAERPAAVSIWARHLIELRDATVLEGHVERWLSPFWALPPRAATRTTFGMVALDFGLQEDETVRQKLRRTTRAITHALTPKSSYGWGRESAAGKPKRKRD
jgi:hypothetical protein